MRGGGGERERDGWVQSKDERRVEDGSRSKEQARNRGREMVILGSLFPAPPA